MTARFKGRKDFKTEKKKNQPKTNKQKTVCGIFNSYLNSYHRNCNFIFFKMTPKPPPPPPKKKEEEKDMLLFPP